MKGLLIRLGVCLAIFGFCLISYLDGQNRVTELKILLPEKERETRLLCEENQRLAYEIERFENPSHLIELAHRPEFRHLRHPLLQEVLMVPEVFAVNE